jgi:hypothetical protein
VHFLETTVTVDQSTLDRFARRCLPPSNTDFAITNLGGQTLASVETRVAGDDKYGANQLHAALAPKQKVTISMPHYRGCQFDLLMAFANKESVEQLNVNLCVFGGISVASSQPPGSAQTTTQTIKNAGKTAITEVYIAPTSDKYWGDDLLAGGDAAHPPTIAPGASGQFSLAVGKTCQFDMKVQYAGGAVEERGNQNVCALAEEAFAAPR